MSDSPAANSAPNPRKWRQAAEYWAVRAAVGTLSLLPFGAAMWTGRRIGDFFRLIDRRHRERAFEQIGDRLGLKGEEAAAFVKRNFRGYGMVMAEFAQLSRMSAEDVARNTDLNGLDTYMHGLLAEGKGLLMITPHYGNWEWCNSAATTIGISGGSIARPLDNPRVNELVRSIRERNGLTILDKQGAIRRALGILRKNGVVGVLIDQDAGRLGMMSPFLGKPASTLTIPVELALRTGSPMVTVVCRRNEPDADKRFTLVHNPEPFRPNPEADPETETRRLIDALNADLSRLILKAPEQWLWVHRRWKSAGRR